MMKRVIVISILLAFVIILAACDKCFAQRSVNSAQQAAESAKETLQDQGDGSQPMIELSDPVNTGEAATDTCSSGNTGNTDSSGNNEETAPQ